MAKRLNPKNFTNFNLFKDSETKYFFYEEREPRKNIFEYDELSFLLEEPTIISLTGHVTDPSKTISRSLFNSYDWVHLSASFADGWLFVYLDFAPGSDTDAKQIRYKVYNLKKK